MTAQRRVRRKRYKATPLRPLTLRSTPSAKRALVWSPDAELAVAADDSVYVFVPQFGGDEKEAAEEEEDDDDDDSEGDNEVDYDDDDDDDDDGARDGSTQGGLPLMTETETRSQFASGSLHIPVAYPPLDVRLNQRLYTAAGLRFPVAWKEKEKEGAGETVDESGTAGAADKKAGKTGKTSKAGKNAVKNPGKAAPAAPAAPKKRQNAETDSFRRPGGAGVGLLTAVAGTMNSVVALAWSPVGVGRNQRAVLGVLTASGVLAVYGEGDGDSGGEGDGSGGDVGHSRRYYDTSRWEALWAVGERMVVPPQTAAQMGECIVSFCWSGPLLARGRPASPGERADTDAGSGLETTRSLLFYRTDRGDVVVLRVGRRPLPLSSSLSSSSSSSSPSTSWLVCEVARFRAAGPHPPMRREAPHYVSTETAFGLRCSPWLAVEAGPTTRIWTCLLGYLAPNYVGFRRVTVTSTRTPDKTLVSVDMDTEDVDGLCLFLGPDAFLEWEEGLWDIAEVHADRQASKVCRGIVATPMIARAFEVVLATPTEAEGGEAETEARGPPPPHDLADCGTIYPSADDVRTNPIQDLIIHPPTSDLGQPAYSLVRQSATATNHDWYETGGGPPDEATLPLAPEAWPQWALDIVRRIKISSMEGVGEDEEEGADEEASRFDDPDGQDGQDGQDGNQPLHVASTGPELFLHRARLWGLAIAPAAQPRVARDGLSYGHGGVTAVLVTEHAARHPDRGGWYRDRSRVLFGWVDSLPRTDNQATATAEKSTDNLETYDRPPASTEARMWAWMYDGGPPVLAAGGAGNKHSQSRRRIRREMVRQRKKRAEEAAAGGGDTRDTNDAADSSQVCSICWAPIDDIDLIWGGSADVSAEAALRLSSSTVKCARGHVFDRCGATGLGIQRPGVSRVCGVCGCRTLRPDAVSIMLTSSAAARAMAERLRGVVTGDVCGRCGGKFHD